MNLNPAMAYFDNPEKQRRYKVRHSLHKRRIKHLPMAVFYLALGFCSSFVVVLFVCLFRIADVRCSRCFFRLS